MSGATIRALAARGLTDREMADELCCSLRLIPLLRQRAGLPPRANGRPVGKVNSPEVRRKIAATARGNRELRHRL